MLRSEAAAHDMQVTQDAFEYSYALSFVNHSDWYRYWALSCNKLGIKGTKRGARVGELILSHTSIVDQKYNPRGGNPVSFQRNPPEDFF